MNHIMLDLETLATSVDAMVLSIGAVSFDPMSDAMGARFYVELTDDLETQERKGRVISARTAIWWMEQDVLARRVFASPGVNRTSTLEGLSTFKQFIDVHGGRNEVELWGNGADFDNMILGSLYDSFSMKVPWSYSRNRCFRTIKSLPRPKEFQAPGRNGVHHNALDDAIYQACYLQAINKCANSR